MTVETLKDCNKKELARMAKDRGIPGWHAMRKDQLVRALTTATAPPSASARSSSTKAHHKSDVKAREPRRRPRPSAIEGAELPSAVSPPRTLDHGCVKDRIITSVRDPYWLHSYWELSRTTLGRAQAAMGQEWHDARPILRLMDVTSEDTTANAERIVRDIPIHGGVNNWYIDVCEPPRSYRVDIGYLSRRGRFFVLARSNVVTTPRAGCADLLDEHWASVDSQYQTIFKQSLHGGSPSRDLQEIFEERLRRPMNPLNFSSLGTGALHNGSSGRAFHFEIDAELIVHGSTEPNAKVTLQGEPVKLRPDGSFSVRFSLPDSRQIIPAVSSSPDGVEERTIVLAVERNTKELEPMIHDGNEL
ncbi:DUF4912 domain-containing protein [Tautonia sociabilis]|uniref:DUF4912 domain-containing protein n=1 Tax=Tautonia sociabilis TaxID=2080755 RepID=A0A432MPV4_9BACT|nr:DUF4912 domain-containing protein [Tautonia sociabilis]RUL89513.1 DUF4912 domain-containing protein [Tautonia sociabilis]